MGYHWDNKMPHLRFSAHLTPNESEAYKAGYAAGFKAGERAERRHTRKVLREFMTRPTAQDICAAIRAWLVQYSLASRKRKEAK